MTPECSARRHIRKSGSRAAYKYPERLRYRRAVFQDLLRKYPADIELNSRYYNLIKISAADELPVLRKNLQQAAAKNPNDFVAVYMGGLSLLGENTPEGIKLLNRAKSLSSTSAWPDVALTDVYGSGGKFADKTKALQSLESYFHSCLDSTNATMLSHLEKLGTPELQAAVAHRLRERLEREKDPAVLQDFSTVWSLEFRTRPPKDHDAVRRQIAADLKRLESLNSKPDAPWLKFLKSGYQQSGASKEVITALEDRILREFPLSGEAFFVLLDRVNEMKGPKPEDPTEIWDANSKKLVEAGEDLYRRCPAQVASKQVRFYMYEDLPSPPTAHAVDVAEDLLTTLGNQDHEFVADQMLKVAAFYLKNGIRTERALALLERVESIMRKVWQRELEPDTLTAENIEEIRKDQTGSLQELDELYLKAYARLHRPQDALRLQKELETPVPKDADQAVQHWANLARFADLEGHSADALSYYQLALHSRLKPPERVRGRVQDQLLDDSRKLWSRLGGTEAGWALWVKPVAGIQELAGGRWERPKKDLPPFELTDLSGAIWSLKRLKGKTLFINLWATWCGPCQVELPHFQKLYEKLKRRDDVAVFTFNVDEELGNVEPFLKEKGYTFPVVPAYSYVNQLIESLGIPQNWIVDKSGKWRWQQLGFDFFDSNWEATVEAKIESVLRGN